MSHSPNQNTGKRDSSIHTKKKKKRTAVEEKLIKQKTKLQ